MIESITIAQCGAIKPEIILLPYDISSRKAHAL